MAYEFERFDQREWADRAYAEALEKRKESALPIESSTLISRLINFPTPRRLQGMDLERAHTWLVRARELTGPTEGDDFIAAAWERYFRERAHTARPRQEADSSDRRPGGPPQPQA